MSGWFLILSCLVEISELKANIADTDQTPRSAASDLGIHRLPVSLLWDLRHKWVKRNYTLSGKTFLSKLLGFPSGSEFIPFRIDNFSERGKFAGKHTKEIRNLSSL